MTKLFIHGVPDTAYMWSPLLEALDLEEGHVLAPSLPGFAEPAPGDFSSTKDAYADWLIGLMSARADQFGGPVHLVGHDWGALLVLRAASLRPDLVASWAVANALIDPLYRGHRMARLWNTPLVGEVMMALSRGNNMSKGLSYLGVPGAVAAHEGRYWSRHMRQAILRLYRSANGLRFEGAWVDDLAQLPERGLVMWGEADPFVDLSVAKRFCARHGVPLKVIEGTGHWGVIEQPDQVASWIKAHWDGASTAPTGGLDPDG